MILPFDRNRLGERNRIDATEELAEAVRRTPSERLELTLELSELVRGLAAATGSDQGVNAPEDLADKAHLYAEPLRALTRGR